MDKFKQTVLSDEFVAAVSDAGTSGKPINFTTAVASTAVLTDDQTAANSYANSQKFSKDTSGNVSGYNNTDTNTIVISVELNNSGLSADVKVSSIFIYAQYNSKDILVATARLNDPELLPAYNGTPVTLEYELYMTLQKTSNVTVQFNNAGLVTRQEGARIDASAVHITGDETVNGVKSFIQKIKGTIEKADKSDLAAKATQLATSHKIGGLAFDGTQDLTLPGVNAKGNQDTTGLAARATKLAANRTIKLQGVVNGSGTFDGTNDLTIKTDPTITENNPNADLSTFNTAGNFYVYGALKNAPISSGYALLQVFKTNGGLVQTFTDLQTEKTYTRTNIISKGYGAWILNADNSAVVQNSGDISTLQQRADGFDATVTKVNNLAVGGRNYILNSKRTLSSQVDASDTGWVGMSVPISALSNNIFTISVQVDYDNVTAVKGGSRIGAEVITLSIQPDGSTVTKYFGVWHRPKVGESFHGRVSATYDMSGVALKSVYTPNHWGGGLYISSITATNVSVSNPKIEAGNIATDWTPAPEDVPSNDAQLVHKNGDETVIGKKTFLTSINSDIDGNSATATAPNVQGIPATTDLNTVKTSGFYSMQVGNATNSPVSNYFSLNVVTVGDYNGTQVLVDTNTGVVWTRSWYSGNTFSEWKNGSDTNVNKIKPTDANNVTQSGTYVFNGANLPSANDYYVFVTRFDDSKVKQVAMRDYDNATFIRTKTGGTWYDWLPLSTTTPIEMSDDYHVDGLRTAGQYTNKSGKMKGLPVYPVWGVLEVMNNGVDIIQRFNISSGDPHTFFQRVYASGSWKDWRVF